MEKHPKERTVRANPAAAIRVPDKTIKVTTTTDSSSMEITHRFLISDEQKMIDHSTTKITPNEVAAPIGPPILEFWPHMLSHIA
jgi:hypothetical protein